LAVDGGEGSASHPSHFTSRERACGSHCTGAWEGPRVSPDVVVKGKKFLSLPGIEHHHLAHGLVTILTELPWFSLKYQILFIRMEVMSDNSWDLGEPQSHWLIRVVVNQNGHDK
jgi:hypothetical protein